MRAEQSQFIPCFCAVFTLLGLKVLFGSKPVTLGSVLLLACMSSAASTAWVGGTGGWVESRMAQIATLATLANRTALPTAGSVLERMVQYVERAINAHEEDQDEL